MWYCNISIATWFFFKNQIQWKHHIIKKYSLNYILLLLFKKCAMWYTTWTLRCDLLLGLGLFCCLKGYFFYQAHQCVEGVYLQASITNRTIIILLHHCRTLYPVEVSVAFSWYPHVFFWASLVTQHINKHDEIYKEKLLNKNQLREIFHTVWKM